VDQLADRLLIAGLAFAQPSPASVVVANGEFSPRECAAFVPIELRQLLATVSWPAEPLDPFFSINTADDLAEAERLAAIDDRT